MLALAALVAVCVVLVFGGKSGGILKPDDAPMIARGEAVYMAHCASCHGKNLEGQPGWKAQDKDGFLPAPPHDESGHTWHHPDTLLFRITKLGVAEAANLKDYKTRMPAFGGILTDADIIAALSYIKSRWPDDVRRRHDELNRVFARRESSAR
ncbi:MAG: cytochrome c [Mesorhizobium sp.]|uniref:c-type cytochrome n=1 Tax=Mesorhizobium sp. TaxID=1871066 RepID=UPI0011F5968E|nr:cytochrome c [Mesorhizobium sp.]TIP71767.1 MAG: cytochrome c [Mesorhizobium sp.]TIQ14593.1 MAG: cytochrome c [Mesorhizobium sp.]TIR52262.1 MAG: cytochrome c [Mesorhizobium sp.]TJV97147.1 MAG: cytochrome c [Mesorhizobium sp.]